LIETNKWKLDLGKSALSERLAGPEVRSAVAENLEKL
jgi:hypothetical protein